jgi:ubiquinone/menaquinone biosynthesis C-methylase UbiE
VQDERTVKEANENFWNGASARWRKTDLPDADRVRAAIDDLGCPPGSTVLDAGCGPGNWSIALAQAGYHVYGIDLSPQMVAEATGKAEEYGVEPGSVQFQVADVEHLGSDNAVFDAILCRNVLDFAPNPGWALVGLKRVLKPGGRMILMTLGAYSPVKRNLWRRFLPGDKTPTIANYITPWEMEALLGELGWEIIMQKPHFGPSAAGVLNEYNEEISERLGDRVLQQTIATSWQFVAVKPDMPQEGGACTRE